MKNILEQAIVEAMGLCYENTSMALDCICEKLYYNYGLNASFSGRSIYIDDARVASIQTCREPCEDAKIVAIYSYTIVWKF